MTAPTPAPPPPRASGIGRIAGTILCVLLAGGAFLICCVIYHVTPGRFDAERMNGIVAAVRRHQVGEEEVAFRVEDMSKPGSLYRLQEPWQAAPNVWARKKSGALQVAVMTQDSGHLGEYGFVFSEVPVTASEDYPTCYDVPGGMRELGRKMDDHWWTAANRDRWNTPKVTC